MKNLHGYARELAIDEMLDKLDLLGNAGQEWGLEDDSTIELYRMNARGESYKIMHAFYKLVCSAIDGDFGFDF